MNSLKQTAVHIKGLPVVPPVSSHEFHSLFYGLWGHLPANLGLSISGGVDSMALAYRMKKLPEIQRTIVHAFIVNHAARPESASECENVAEIMARFNFRPHILPLIWENDEIPSSFETVARTCRYRALARACVKNKVDHLLLGHHADDQVETVLMRLLNYGRGFGLIGMKPTSRMPETYGIHGAEHIQIGRPFLGIPKARLRSTCEVADVTWFEDYTNKDPTYTQRNAIRQLLSEEPSKLPTALHKAKLFSLSKRITLVSKNLDIEADIVIGHCNVVLNSKWGTLQMVLPERRFEDMDSKEVRVMITVLTRMAEMICPTSKVKRANIIKTFRRIIQQDDPLKRMVINGPEILWKREADGVWTLSRTPFPVHSLSHRNLHIPFKPNALSEWSEWKLWDGRWWIRIRHLDSSGGTVVVRPLDKRDMRQVKEQMIALRKSDPTAKTLSALPPESLRFTLPVICLDTPEGKTPVLIALPSLAVTLMNWKHSPPSNTGKLIDWQMKFRSPL